MIHPIDRGFGEKLLQSMDDFYARGVEWLFNEWWESAPADAIAKYEAAIADHPEQGPLAREGWLAPDFRLAALADCAPGTLGAAWRDFVVDHGLVEQLAAGYHAAHRQLAASGKLARMPPLLEYKVLRGWQTHDLHHVLTGYPPTPFGELALQAFQLAQVNYPYSAMWMTIVAGHMTCIDPYLINPAMDAITDGWTLGRRSRSIQFVKFESMVHQPLEQVRAAFGLTRPEMPDFATPAVKTPELIAGQ